MNYLINILRHGVKPHKHRNYEIIVCTKGTGVFHFSKKDIEITSGEIIIIPKETVHYSSAVDENYEIIYINGEFNYIFELTTPTVIYDNSRGDGVVFANMIYNNRFANNEYITALINAFTLFLLQNIKTDTEIFLTVKDIIEKITENYYDSNINLSHLLKKSGYAEDYVRAKFKKITGKTPTEFLTTIRISHACCLIKMYRNSVPLGVISEKCGYTDYIYFSRRFKHIMGVSPSEYISNFKHGI